MQSKAIFISLCIWVVSMSSGYAEKMLSGAELRAGLVAYLAEQGYDAQPAINPSRLVKPCNQPLRYTPLFGNVQTVEIACPDKGGWKLAIRTKIGASARKQPDNRAKKSGKMAQTVSYVVARQSLKRGDIVTASDLELVTGRPSGFSDYFNSVDALIGRRLKRQLAIGKMMRASYLEADWMVREGQPVTMESQIGQVQVISEGRALENAQWGEVARFLNVVSGRQVFATVVSEKKVIIGAKKL